MSCPACAGRKSVRIVPAKGGLGSGPNRTQQAGNNPRSAKAQGERFADKLRYTGRRNDR